MPHRPARGLVPTTALLAVIGLASPLPALAQSADLAGMQEGLTMLETSVSQAFTRYGVEADPQALSLSQLAAIHGILSSDEPEGQKRQRVETIVAQ